MRKPESSPPQTSAIRLLRLIAVLGCLLALLGGGAVATALLLANRTPSEWAPYVRKRVSRHNPIIEAAGEHVAAWLDTTGRLHPPAPFPLPTMIGSAETRSGPVPTGHLVPVASVSALLDAIAAARAGDVIQLAPGNYQWAGTAIRVGQAGTQAEPIILRGARLGSVVIESRAVVTFNVAAPFWRFENLAMHGACEPAGDCEHAFHVVQDARGTVFRNNRLEDYNAAIKINGEHHAWPDGGLIEGNSLINNFARDTGRPITPIDMVGASDWTIRGNIIADFVRAWPGSATYGAFAKGAGSNTVFEQNLVICEWRLRSDAGPHVGLSLGGGGTGRESRRDLGHTGLEHSRGVIRDNLIAGCNDDGIYLNAAAGAVVEHNTLLDTGGIEARFMQTSAIVRDNIVDGVVRARDGAALEARDNATDFLLSLFAGWHRGRGYFTDPASLSLSWRSRPDAVSEGTGRPDLCGQTQTGPA